MTTEGPDFTVLRYCQKKKNMHNINCYQYPPTNTMSSLTDTKFIKLFTTPKINDHCIDQTKITTVSVTVNCRDD